MKSLPLAAAAFLAGLAPGLLLYWNAVRAIPPAPATPAVQAPAISVSSPPSAPPVTPAPKTAGTEGARPSPAAAQNVAALEQQLRERVERLAALDASLAEARSSINILEGRIATLLDQASQAQVNEKGLRVELDSAIQRIGALQSEIRTREAKSSESEAGQLRLAMQATEAAQKTSAKTLAVASELEDISRRREAYLTQILTRYREATDLFRALSLRLDNPRDAGSPYSHDLSRIQQAVQSADEDLRQLRALNQGSTRLLKELAAAGKK
jgi:chromosome segregation ATPase